MFASPNQTQHRSRIYGAERMGQRALVSRKKKRGVDQGQRPKSQSEAQQAAMDGSSEPS